MSIAVIAEINKEDLLAVGEDPLLYLMFFANKYFSLIASDSTGEIQQVLPIEANILLAFVSMDNQVSNGGFLQLIENGYGSYIFYSPLSEYLRDWGALRTADIIDAARSIYHIKKEILERKKTLEEFARSYQEHKDFEQIENLYYMYIDAERKIVKEFVASHLALFARIV